MNQDISENKKIESYFTPTQWFLFFTVILAGIILRWVGLDERPLHHDESLHVMYGKYYFDNISSGFYKYDPMLHGPLLYTLLMFVYQFLGVTEWAARAPSAFFGTLFVLLPFLFRRYFTPRIVLFTTALVSLSPTLVYWSRFIREDFVTLTGIFLMLIGVTLARDGYKALCVSLGLSIQMCGKESWYVHLAIIFGYIIFDYFIGSFSKREIKSEIKLITDYITKFWLATLVSIGLGGLLYVLFYSAGFQYSKGILDGLYRSSIAYWWEHHSKERIEGPFLFHFFMLSWYEWVFLLLLFLQNFLFFKISNLTTRSIGGAVLLIAFLSYVYFRNYPEYFATLIEAKPELSIIGFLKIFKIKSALDVAGFIIIPSFAVLVTTAHMLRGERILAMSAYGFWAIFASYSYLGEKVPWLSQYPFIAGIIYLAVFFDHYFQRYPISSWREFIVGDILFYVGSAGVVLWLLLRLDEPKGMDLTLLTLSVVALGVSLVDSEYKIFPRTSLINVFGVVFAFCLVRSCLLTNFTKAGEASEFISQVHTTEELASEAIRIRSEVSSESLGYKPKIYVTGDGIWPLTWYFRDLPEYKFDNNVSELERNTYDYQFINWKDQQVPPPGYTKRQLKLRGWWVPDYKKMTLRKFLKYSWNHTPWSDTGYSYITELKKIK